MFVPPMPLATRATPITPDDKSTAVTITAWLLMAIFVLVVLSRVVIKWVVLRRFQADDAFILFATVFGIGLSATALILASDGLGIMGELTTRRANAIMKGYYASDFLYVLSICFAKLSLVAWFYSIGVDTIHRRVVQALGIFILAWTSASLIAVAFQCGLPRPWEILTLHCYNSGVFWIVYTIIDMTTDVSIIMLSVNLVAYLKVRFSRKVMVVACFAPRILVIGAALARLIFLYPITPHDNPEFHLWIPIICALVQVCLSISTACVLYVKPFIESVEAGVWRADVRRKGTTTMRSHGYQRARGKEMYSVDSTTAGTSLKFGRTPDVSPRIPSPVPLSPMTPPRLSTPPNTRSGTSRSPSERGLRLHIPPPEERKPAYVTSPTPQTASSHALSPACLSPQPLLSPPPFSTTRRPTPPPRAHNPRPSYGSADLNTLNPTSPSSVFSPPVSISNFPRPPNVQYSPFPPEYRTPLPPVPPLSPRRRPSSRNRAKRVSVHRMPPNTSSQRFPVRTTSLQNQQPRKSVKFSTTSKPNAESSTRSSKTTSYYKQSPASDLTIPSYYTKTPPVPEIPIFPTPPSPRTIQTRRQRILTPQNSSRRDQISPVSPVFPPQNFTFWRAESSSESAGPSASSSAGPTPMWDREEAEAHWPPVMRDVRSSPRIVVQRFS
ncbi:hypothetical protein BDV96DRAFT_19997 [Lophiotrema nucula]|uniref:Rhodopsin domain-containing protein n=1 Tax=Lophiotrema nucula TaxID=690887 RepID=A0A6A5ZFI7_9PLEO|nr:hypothetical protein BDV96DRAFT_19997 [Lophiotrema nucula]